MVGAGPGGMVGAGPGGMVGAGPGGMPCGPLAATAMIAETTMSTGITSMIPSGMPGNSFSKPRA